VAVRCLIPSSALMRPPSPSYLLAACVGMRARACARAVASLLVCMRARWRRDRAERRQGAGGHTFLAALAKDHDVSPSFSPRPDAAASIHSSASASPLQAASKSSVAIVVGPEGGWAEGEVEALLALLPHTRQVHHPRTHALRSRDKGCLQIYLQIYV
jgi:hypothetical protein